MNNLFIGFICLLLLCGCELSTEQEMDLNKEISELLKARNRGDALSYLNSTHPIVVKHYKLQGDSIFKHRFQLVEPKTSRNNFSQDEIYWTNAYQKSMKSNDTIIQVEIEIDLSKGNSPMDSSLIIYGMTKKEVSNWLFIEEQDYRSAFFPKELRLFKESE